MRSISTSNFGLVIAYLLPGFTALWGLSYVSQTIRSWLAATPTDAPTVGGFLYVTLGSIAAGLTVSTVRWAVIDTIHHWTGISPPHWDFSRLQENINAFSALVEIHYRYYQFYANMLVSLVLACAVRWQALGLWSDFLSWHSLAFLLLGGIFFVASRDTLRKYYSRTAQMLDTVRRTGEVVPQLEGGDPHCEGQQDKHGDHTRAVDGTPPRQG